MKPKGREIREVADTRNDNESSGNADAMVSRRGAHRSPFEALNPPSSKSTPKAESSKTSAAPSETTKSQALTGKQQINKEPSVMNRIGQREEWNTSGGPVTSGKLGRAGPSRVEDIARPSEVSHSSSTVPSALRPENRSTYQSSETQAMKPEVSRSGWESRYVEASRNEKWEDKSSTVERNPSSDKPANSTAALRGVALEQDNQASNSPRRNGTEDGAPSFKQRMQGLVVGKENNLIKPLKDKLTGPKQPEASQIVPGQTSRSLAGNAPIPQTEDQIDAGQQQDHSASLGKPSKEWKPYTTAKTLTAPSTKANDTKGRATPSVEWVSPDKTSMPTRPERPQDELFMGVSGPALRPDAPLNNNADLNIISQPSPSTDRNLKEQSTRVINALSSENKTGRPDILERRKPAEVTRSAKFEQDSREYTPVIADISANPVSYSPRSGKGEAPAVRVVSGTIERPREIDIPKPIRLEKNLRLSRHENLSDSDVTGNPEAIPVRLFEKPKMEQHAPPFGRLQVAEPLQITDPSGTLESQRGNTNINQTLRHEKSETQNAAAVDEEWPRPVLTPSVGVEKDVADRSRAIDNYKKFAPESRSRNVSEDTSSLEPVNPNQPGLLGRWVGRAKRELTPERTNTSVASQSPLVTTETKTGPGFQTVSGVQKLGPRETSGLGISTLQPGHRAREDMGVPSTSAVENSSRGLRDVAATQSSAPVVVPSGLSQMENASPPHFSSHSDADRADNDVPAPLSVAGRRSARHRETEPKSHGRLDPRLPYTAETQAFTNPEYGDRARPDTGRANHSDLISPELPSQEAFYKQMRQSVMFQNSDPAEKTDLPGLTDATMERKSRRNRNISISGLQPARGITVPDVPTFDNSDHHSTMGRGDSTLYHDGRQTASDSWPGRPCLGDSQRHNVGTTSNAEDMHSKTSRATSREDDRSGTCSVAPVQGEKLPAYECSGSPQFSSSGLRAGVKMMRTNAAAMAEPRTASLENDALNAPTDEHKVRDATEYPLRVSAVEQTDLRLPDVHDNLQAHPVSESTASGYEQSLPFGSASRSMAPEMTVQEVKMGRVTETERIPLHPAPSSAGILRRPSFEDQEGLRQPVTANNVSPSETPANPRVENFFDSLFRTNKTEEFASGLGTASPSKEEITHEGWSAESFNSGPVKEQSATSQLVGVGKGSETFNEFESPLPMPAYGRADLKDSKLSEVATFPSDMLKTPTQTARIVPGARTTPITSLQPAKGDAEVPNDPVDVSTSAGSEMSEPLVKGKVTDTSSPYSSDMPTLYVEDVSATPASQNKSIVDYSESSTSFDQHLARLEPEDLISATQTTPGTRSSFTSYQEVEKRVPLATSALTQDEKPIHGAKMCYASYEPGPREVVEDAAFSTQPASMAGKPYVQLGTADNTHLVLDNKEHWDSDAHQTGVLNDRSPVPSVHGEGQQGFHSQFEVDGNLEQATALTNFDSPLALRRDPGFVEGRVSPWGRYEDTQDIPSGTYNFHGEPDQLQSPEDRGHILSSLYPSAGAGFTTSPQESDPDLSDHILSLYDGSEYHAPDHQSTGGFPDHLPPSSDQNGPRSVVDSAYARSSRELHSPIVHHRTSLPSIEPMSVEALETPFTTSKPHDLVTAESFASSRSDLEPLASSRPVLSSPRELSEHGDNENESIEPALLKNGSMKDRLRRLFGKTDSAEPGADLHASPLLEAPTGDMVFPEDWTHAEGPNLVSPLSGVEIGPGLAQPENNLEQLPLGTSPYASTDFDDIRGGTGRAHEILASPLPDPDAYDTVPSSMDPSDKATSADDNLSMSPMGTAYRVKNDRSADSVMPEEEEIRFSSAPMSELQLASPGFELDTFQSGESLVPHEEKHSAGGSIGQIEDSYEGSPRFNHIPGDETFGECGPANATALNESSAPRSPDGDSSNDVSIHNGSFSPAIKDVHSEDSAAVSDNAAPGFDAPSRYPDADEYDVLNDQFAIEQGNVREDFKDTADGDFRTEDYQHGPQESESVNTNGSVAGLDQVDGGRFDKVGDDSVSITDLHGDIRDPNNTGSISYPADDFLSNNDGFEKTQSHAPDAYQGDLAGPEDLLMDDHSAGGIPSNLDGLHASEADDYSLENFQSYPGAYDDSGNDIVTVDGIPSDTAGSNDLAIDDYAPGEYGDNQGQPFDPAGAEPNTLHEQDYDSGFAGEYSAGFDPGNHNRPFEESVSSEDGEGKDTELGLEADPLAEAGEVQGDDHEKYHANDEHFGENALHDDEPELVGQEDELYIADNIEGGNGGLGSGEELNDHQEVAELDRGLNGEYDDFAERPSLEADGEQPADFVEGGSGKQSELFVADWDPDQPDVGRGMDEAEGLPMNYDEDLPMGGEAEEYFLGGDSEHYPDTMEAGVNTQMDGEPDGWDHPMSGGEEHPLDTMAAEQGFPLGGDDELPIDEMYGGEERELDTMDEGDFPIEGDEALPLMDEEYPVEQDVFPIEGKGVAESDRGIDAFDVDDHYGEDMSGHESMPDEEYGSQFDDGLVDDLSLSHEEIPSDIADEDRGSILSDQFDEEPGGDIDLEEEEIAPSEVDDREVEDGLMTAAGEENGVGAEGDGTMDDIYDEDVASIPASPTSTDYGRDLASPASSQNHDTDGQDEGSIFGEPTAQQEPADIEDTTPVRLSCLYMQDVGLLSLPPSPTIPQENGATEQGEEEEEEPREPVRFSALYRQSLDWSQALDSSMWEDDNESLPEEDGEEQMLTAPILQTVPDLARRGSQEDLHMLEVDQEPLSPGAASPLSPRPLTTPPPETSDVHGGLESHHLIDHPEDLYKGADDPAHQQYPLSPRMQPTPPPDYYHAPVSNGDQYDRRDSRGPRTFDEMDLPQRVISPTNAGDDQVEPTQGSASTTIPTHGRVRSISQRFSGWWSGGGSSGQAQARPPPLPAPYDSRYGEPGSPV